jgi:hypothetical protein
VEARDKGDEMGRPIKTAGLRDRSLSHNPANSAQSASLQELSDSARLRGGAGRTRTTEQEIIINAPGGSTFQRLRKRVYLAK